MSKVWSIRLGTKVVDAVTGFEGVATARLEFLNGCVQYCVTPRVDKKGKIQEGYYLDSAQLVVPDVGDCVFAKENEDDDVVGGPSADAPTRYKGA